MSCRTDKTTPETCGCCDGEEQAPDHDNQPGLDALSYRVGMHPSFLDRMKARISRRKKPDGEGEPNLSALTTRAPDDPAIALMDAAAVSLDVLTFYQERIANEGFLRTATERRSVLELARAIGYELDPGVAAETYVAFTVDESEGAPSHATVPKGTQVQSIPATQDELPQTFETREDLNAQRAWNRMRPRLRQPQTLTPATTRVYLEGTGNDLESGDVLLLLLEGTAVPKRAFSVEIDTDEDRTRVDFVKNASESDPAAWPAPTEGTLDLDEKLTISRDRVRSEVFEKVWDENDLQNFLAFHEWEVDDVLAYVADLLGDTFEDDARQVLVMREKLGFFGHNAPYHSSLPDFSDATGSISSSAARSGEDLSASAALSGEEASASNNSTWPIDWDAEKLSVWLDSVTGEYYDLPSDEFYDVYLDRPVSGLVVGSWAVFERPQTPFTTYVINDHIEASRAGYGMSARVTGLDLRKEDGTTSLGQNDTDKPPEFHFRTSTAYVKSEKLEMAALPVTDLPETGEFDEQEALLLSSDEILLDAMVPGLQVGQAVVLTGEEMGGAKRREILTLEEIRHSLGYTKIAFEKAFAYDYKRDTVTINANVVGANHGETVNDEALGGGDGSVPNQRFRLKKPPLTYVSTSATSGSESTLAVRVNGVRWQEVSSLYGLGPDSKSYIVRLEDDGKANVIFGDGKHGARLPTGQENVRATYRSGIGSVGAVGAGSLQLLKTRPFGIRGVTNPVRAAGAEDPEKLRDARVNAPLKVLTLDRIVSLRDYEDFARAFSGIGKAQARAVWNGQTEVVHITLADAGGNPVTPDMMLFTSLLEAIEASRDPLRDLLLAAFEPHFFRVRARVLIDPAYLWDTVKSSIEDALLAAFSFEERDFGQPVSAAEVVTTIHDVEGVVAVDLDELFETEDPAGSPTGSALSSILPAPSARYDKDQKKILPAHLLLISEYGITLEKMST